MKHILNNIPKEEKHRILNLHTGGMKVVTENFKKLINSKMGNVKPLMEAAKDPEPVIKPNSEKTIQIWFEEGKSTIPSIVKEKMIEFIRESIIESLPTIQKFHNDPTFKLPPIAYFYVGTSHTGSFERNANLANSRLNLIKSIFVEALSSLGVRRDIAEKLYLVQDKEYNPSNLDLNLFDPKKLNPNANERFATLVIKQLHIKGRDEATLDNMDDALRMFANRFNVEEEGIAEVICGYQTYSDLIKSDRKLKDLGGLEYFINKNITDGLTTLGSDVEERKQIVGCLNNAAMTSGKGKIAKIIGDKVSIIFQ
jgi:hypothetical protein